MHIRTPPDSYTELGGTKLKGSNRRQNRLKTAIFIISLTLCFTVAGLPALAENTLKISAENSPPIAENIEICTFRNIEITGTLAAVDPEGDEVSFEITRPPKKGALTPLEDGMFIYQPGKGEKGKDSFSYVAVDCEGNVSREATVNISIKKQSTKLTYSDTDGSSAAYAALVLAEKGVFTGEKLGDEYFFKPDAKVTRSEFLAMCLKLSGAEPLNGIVRTGFYDDDAIPTWAKPYISTALMSGMITGYKDEAGKLVFSPGRPITFSEASVILNNALKITDVVTVAAIQPDDPAVPTWAYTAAVNLVSCRILPTAISNLYSETLTRADAAKMLLSASELLENRDSGKSLLNWAK